MNELNNVAELTPAFNKNLLKVESTNISNDRYQYIVDVLLNEMLIQYVFNALTGYPQYAGYTALQGASIANQYVQGDSVMFFDVTNNSITGIYKVLAVPDNSTVVIDLVWGGVGFYLGEGWLYKLYRNKLPQLPDGTATFNINGFAPGVVGYHFLKDDFGMFNVPENFERYKYLVNEEYYDPISFNTIEAFNQNLRIDSSSRQVPVGTVVQIIQDTGSTYNGIFEVIAIANDGDMILSGLFQGSYTGTGTINVLPKDLFNDLIYDDISTNRFVFNGALPFPKDIRFDYVDYDATQTQLCQFLTNIPDGTKVYEDSLGYIQFFQSDKNTCTQYVVDVTDSLGVVHQYIINLNGDRDNVLGISIGPGGLSGLTADDFDTIPTRGLPVIQECDECYDVYLQGSTGCNIDGTQAVQFPHPDGFYGINFLNSTYWGSNSWFSMQVQAQSLIVGGVTQPVNQTGNTYNQTQVTGQSFEDIYADEMEAQTGLTVRNASEISASSTDAIFGSPHEITIDFDQDFELNIRIVIERRQTLDPFKPQPLPVIFDIEYKWDASLCETTYKVNGQDLSGFTGLSGNPSLAPIIQLSEKKTFCIEWSRQRYPGARLIFQDRLGSMPGVNFPLKVYKQQNASSDGFERDVLDISRTDIDAGFETIQTSYTIGYSLNTDWLTQEEMNYLAEAFTSPKAFLQIEGEVMPCKILPGEKTIQSKDNRNLLITSLDVLVYGTNYTQRN